MISRSTQRRNMLIGAALLGALGLPHSGQCEEGLQGQAAWWATPKTGETTLKSGLRLSYSYYHNRNATMDHRVVGQSIVVLTEAGHLIRFDARTLMPTTERLVFPGIRLLADGKEGQLLACRDDGTIHRVDPVTLKLTPAMKLDSCPTWLAYDREGKTSIAVVDGNFRDIGTNRRVSFLPKTKPGESPKSAEYRESIQQWICLRRSKTLLVDRRRRLWYAQDNGEWGGWCGYADLAKETLGKHFSSSGAYGLIELSDGQVWAYGGTSHMGSNGCFIARLDRGQFESLFDNDLDAEQWMRSRRENKPPTKPGFPITHILEEGKTGNLIVLAFGEVFRVDKGLKEWKFIGRLNIRYRPGRPDAMGSYPAVRRASVLSDKARTLVCSTTLDGMTSLAGGVFSPRALPQQYEGDNVSRIQSTPAGTLLWEFDGARDTPLRPWLVERDQVARVSWRPPIKPDSVKKATHAEKQNAQDSDESLTAFDDVFNRVGADDWTQFYSPDGHAETMTTVHSTGNVPGPICVVQWKAGRPTVLATESTRLWVGKTFSTPDGLLWEAAGSRLERFVGNKWVDVAGMPVITEPNYGPKYMGMRPPIKVINRKGPPWLLAGGNPSGGNLLLARLSYGKTADKARIEAIALPKQVGKDEFWIWDAIALDGNRALLAATGGLQTVDVRTGKLAAATLPGSKHDISNLGRDGMGRVWMGSRGLWMLAPDGKVLHDLSVLPMVENCVPGAIGPDAQHRGGVVVHLVPGQLLRIRASMGKTPSPGGR